MPRRHDVQEVWGRLVSEIDHWDLDEHPRMHHSGGQGAANEAEVPWSADEDSIAAEGRGVC